MISTQRLLDALKEMSSIAKCRMMLYQVKDEAFFCASEAPEELKQVARAFAQSPAQMQFYREYSLFRVMVDDEFAYVLITEGLEENREVVAQLAICQIRTLVQSMEERFDRNNFIQSILLGNMLTVDIHSKAKKLHVADRADRVVFVISTEGSGMEDAMEVVTNLTDPSAGDIVTSVEENSLVLVRMILGVREQELESRLSEYAASLVGALSMEAMVKARVGYGNLVHQLPDIARSYQEAKMALDVGRIFYAEKETIAYARLGIGRLIYQLPMSLCEMYIREVFGERIPDILENDEAMSTVNQFFDNSLNISETARQLYVHRNTLVYRLERIEKAIGLDIRRFDEAMTFRIALMVLAHMRDNN